MADTTALKNRIRAAIKANDNQEITGPVLQQTLLDIVDELDLNPKLQEAINAEKNARQNQDAILRENINTLGGNVNTLQTTINNINTKLAEGYIYAGIATPSTNPGTISGKVFYIAVQAGTYTNFGSMTVIYGINILKYNGDTWSYEQIIAIDDVPTAGSDNLAKSGDVFNIDAAVQALGIVPNKCRWTKHLAINTSGVPTPIGITYNGYVSSFIHVVAGVEYYYSGCKPSRNYLAIAGYSSDDDTSFVSDLDTERASDNADVRKITIPTGVNYVKLSFIDTIANFGGIWNIQDTGILPNIINELNIDLQGINIKNLEQGIKNLEQGIKNLEQDKLDRICGVNIIDPSKLILGYLNINGVIVETPDSAITVYNVYIPVKSGDSITAFDFVSRSDGIRTFAVYDINKEFVRGISTTNVYTWQDGDAFVRIGFPAVTADYPTQFACMGGTLLAYEPYTDYAPIEELRKELHESIKKIPIENNESIKKIPIENIINGIKEVICTGSESYWNANANSNFYDDYFEFFENAGAGQTWVSSILLYPDMGKYLYVKAKVTNTGEGVTNYGFLVNPIIGVGDHEWQIIGSGTLQVGETKEVLLPVDLANLVIYHNFHDTLAIWVQCAANANYNTKIKVENFEAYQINDKEEFAHFEGNNLPELMHSIDDAFDNVTPSGASSEILISPTGKRYILSVDINGALTTIPLYPKEMYAYGNSLLISRGFGLAASDQHHDFYALLCQFFLTKESRFTSNKTGIAFEQSTTLQDALDKADILVQNTPSTTELLIIQGGDNVASTNYETIWKPALSHFIESLRQRCTRARIVLVASWYGSITNVMTDVANKYGVLFVNIVPCRGASSNSHLGAIITNIQTNNRSLANVTSCVEQTNNSQDYEHKLAVTFTVNDVSYNTTLYCHSYSLNGTTLSYNSEQEVIDTAGEASHPGNEGFRLIANKILYDGGYVDIPDYYTTN